MKFQAQRSVKDMLTVFWNMKGSITIDFLEKGATLNSVFMMKAIFPLLIE